MTSDRPGNFRLVACGRHGETPQPLPDLAPAMIEARDATVALYDRTGFSPPWIGYVAVAADQVVGGGAFVAPPADNRVEIAYFTLPEHQGLGHARRIATGLIGIAREAQPDIEIRAKTAPTESPSTAILTRLGFRRDGTETDHEIGEAWSWLLRP